MKNTPPIGVIGPNHLYEVSPIKSLVANKYMEPEKHTIPIRNNHPAVLKVLILNWAANKQANNIAPT